MSAAVAAMMFSYAIAPYWFVSSITWSRDAKMLDKVKNEVTKACPRTGRGANKHVGSSAWHRPPHACILG